MIEDSLYHHARDYQDNSPISSYDSPPFHAPRTHCKIHSSVYKAYFTVTCYQQTPQLMALLSYTCLLELGSSRRHQSPCIQRQHRAGASGARWLCRALQLCGALAPPPSMQPEPSNARRPFALVQRPSRFVIDWA